MGKGKRSVRFSDENDDDIGMYTSTSSAVQLASSSSNSSSLTLFSTHTSTSTSTTLICDDISFVSEYDEGNTTQKVLLEQLLGTSRGFRFLLFHLFKEGMDRDKLIQLMAEGFYEHMKEKILLPIVELEEVALTNLLVSRLINLDRKAREGAKEILIFFNVKLKCDESIVHTSIGDINHRYFQSGVVWLDNASSSQLAMKNIVDEKISSRHYPCLFPTIALLVILKMAPTTSKTLNYELIGMLQTIANGNGIEFKTIIKTFGLLVVSFIYAICFYLIKDGVLPRIKYSPVRSSASIQGGRYFNSTLS